MKLLRNWKLLLWYWIPIFITICLSVIFWDGFVYLALGLYAQDSYEQRKRQREKQLLKSSYWDN